MRGPAVNKNQARMMLAFIADLYSIIQTPDPPAAEANGHGHIGDPVRQTDYRPATVD